MHEFKTKKNAQSTPTQLNRLCSVTPTWKAALKRKFGLGASSERGFCASLTLTGSLNLNTCRTKLPTRLPNPIFP